MSELRVTCALIERSERILVARRPEGKALAGKWEFPGGKIDPGESPESCLEREIEEELGCHIRIDSALTPSCHTYPNGTIELIPFRCSIVSGEPEALEHAEIKWMEPSRICEIDLADADTPILTEYLNLRHASNGAS